MDTLTIIKDYLTENEFDGLFYPGECACKKDDLAPCGQINPECEPGYLGPGNAECDYSISRERPSVHEKECPDCGALVCVDGIEKYGQVECHNCFAMLEYDEQSLIELSD